MGEVVPDALAPLDAVTVYPVIVEPPVVAGAVKATDADGLLPPTPLFVYADMP